MSRPDQRIDVNGATWKKLVAVAGAVSPGPPVAAPPLITLTVTHGDKVPTATKFKTAKQTAAELKVKTQGIRAGLLVNARNAVSVQSDDPKKTTSVGINVHNGFNSSRGSDGCLFPPSE